MMTVDEFRDMAIGNTIIFLLAWSFVLENGQETVLQASEKTIMAAMTPKLTNFFSEEAYREIVRAAKELAQLSPSDLIEYIQQCEQIVRKPGAAQAGSCPLCGGELEYCDEQAMRGERMRAFKCLECGAYGEESLSRGLVQYWNVHDRTGARVLPAGNVMPPKDGKD